MLNMLLVQYTHNNNSNCKQHSYSYLKPMIDFYSTNKPDYILACVRHVSIYSLASIHASELNAATVQENSMLRFQPSAFDIWKLYC
jgi:hypothetical protein